jgi:hypothetical protein
MFWDVVFGCVVLLTILAFAAMIGSFMTEVSVWWSGRKKR